MPVIPIAESTSNFGHQDANVPFAIEDAVVDGGGNLDVTIGDGRITWGGQTFELATGGTGTIVTEPTIPAAVDDYYVVIDIGGFAGGFPQLDIITTPPATNTNAELVYLGYVTTTATPTVDSITDLRSFQPSSGGWRGFDGSATAPTFGFADDPDTGMYRITADEIGFTTGGTQVLRLTDEGGAGGFAYVAGVLDVNEVQADDGSPTDPSFTFRDDEDSGFYRVGTNSVGVAMGGSLVGQWTTTGLTITGGLTATTAVTVGNTTYDDGEIRDTGQLVLDAGAGTDLVFQTGNVTRGLYDDSIDAWRWWAGTTEHLRLDGSKLIMQGNGTILTGQGSNTDPGIHFFGDGDTGMYHVSSGTIGFACNSGVTLQLTTGGRSLFASGTQSLPAISFQADGNSGFMSFSNGDFRACINGAYRMQWSSEVAVVNTNFRPDTNNARNCGTSSSAWSTVWRYSSQSPSDPALKSNVQDVPVSSSAEVVRAFRDTGIKEYTYNNGSVGQAGPQGEAPGGGQGGGQGVPPVKTSGLDDRINARRHRGVMAPDLHTALNGKVTPEALDTYVIEPDPDEPDSTWGVSYEATIPDLLNVVADLLDRIEALENA